MNDQQRHYQRKRMQREIAERTRKKEERGDSDTAGEFARKSMYRTVDLMSFAMGKISEAAEKHPLLALLIAGTLVLVILLVSIVSGASLIGSGGGNTMIITSFTAEDEDILAVDADYSNLEQALREKIGRIESDYPGYDEYRYDLAEIGHNPFVLAVYLTCVYEDYREDEVQAELESLFEEEYVLTLTPKTEIRTRTETRTGTRPVYSGNTITGTETYSYTVEVEYEYKILNVKLENMSLDGIARSRMDSEQTERYDILLETKGNKAYLFEGGWSSDGEPESPGASPDVVYEPSGEALSDTEFAAMWQEARKYLGMAYVWGGSSPSTGFDCSGFVSWVINHSGTGNIGRKTAEGLREWTNTIPSSERKPGDLIFFQGTYATNGASHVGIYIGDGKMIHCGDPIKISNVDSGYFKQHFLCYGRIPD